MEDRKPETAPESGRKGMSRSMLRLTAILDLLLKKAEPLSIQEMVEELGISRTTAYEIVRSLVSVDYLERQGPSGRFYLGRRLYELGMAYHDQISLLSEGRKVIEALCEETNETVQLSVLDDDKILVLLKNQSDQSISIISKIGSRIPVNWASSGRLLVSDWPDEELRRRLPNMIEPSPTGEAPTDIEILIREIRHARARGYAFQIHQANRYAGAVAAPIIDANNKCIATVSVVAPDHRLKRQQRQRIIEAVTRAASGLSLRLGG